MLGRALVVTVGLDATGRQAETLKLKRGTRFLKSERIVAQIPHASKDGAGGPEAAALRRRRRSSASKKRWPATPGRLRADRSLSRGCAWPRWVGLSDGRSPGTSAAAARSHHAESVDLVRAHGVPLSSRSALFRSAALVATMIELSDISSADHSGRSSIP